MLADLDGVQHRFFTRRGGISAGLYSSLNCGYGSGDSPDNVRENRRRVAATFALGEADLLTVHQTHSTDVLTVADQRWTSPGAPKADGLVSDRPGVVLGVLAADCAPVLLADGTAGVIGAAHAGWKGALGGVAEATIAAMGGWAPARAPARGDRSASAATHEVGPEFPRRFSPRTSQQGFFRPPALGHFLFDLAGYLARRLAQAGVAGSATGHDTLAGADDFFSYRRNTLSGMRDYGRGLSAITLKA